MFQVAFSVLEGAHPVRDGQVKIIRVRAIIILLLFLVEMCSTSIIKTTTTMYDVARPHTVAMMVRTKAESQGRSMKKW
jgi:hypothetical protein